MDPTDVGIFLGLMGPVYYALFNINQKIGKFDRLCREFDTLAKEHADRVSREEH
jgi:hypothetical protein